MTAKVLKQLIDKTGIPFITTQMGKGVVDERHPRFLGNAALSSGDFVHRAVEAADLIISGCLGCCEERLQRAGKTTES